MWQIVLRILYISIVIYDMAKDNGKLFWKIIYTIWQKYVANHFLDFIYIDWQISKANRLKFKHTIIDDYRCKIEWTLAYKYNYRTQL